MPSENRLEELKGDLAVWLSIRVNQRWSLVLSWLGNEAHDVWLTDYH